MTLSLQLISECLTRGLTLADIRLGFELALWARREFSETKQSPRRPKPTGAGGGVDTSSAGSLPGVTVPAPGGSLSRPAQPFRER